MVDAKPISTALCTKTVIAKGDTPLFEDCSKYRSIVGGLQYLTMTRPDIAFAVNKLCQFMHAPAQSHWAAVKRLLRYVKQTLHYGIFLNATAKPVLQAFADADWAGSVDDRRSTSGLVVYLGSNLLCWRAQKQKIVSRSSTDAEYKALADASAELVWICSLLKELRVSIPEAPILWCDNLGATFNSYEADDFLDEIAYKLEFKEVHHTCSDQQRNLLIASIHPCRKVIGNHMKAKLEEILGRLEFLLRQKDALGLVERAGKTTNYFLVDDSGIHGRTEDKEANISSVLSEAANRRHLGVVPIIGMGGVGKTTLAQLVYNDNRVKQQFGEFRAWVCVSEEFDVFKLTRSIFKEMGFYDCDSLTPNQLQVELEEKVRGQKIMLVLDDVWNDNYAEWDHLLAPLNSVAQGSKVVVTTRIQSVASVMSSVASPIHKLKESNDDDCWSLFAMHAFDDCSPSSYPDLVEIGSRISGKYKGLPLAAKTIGGLLRCKRDAGEWGKILESNTWDLPNDNIIPALRLSYHCLPPHLKQCFAYCAMFPKDFKFKKEDLVLLWMAEEFVLQANQVRDTETIAAEYFEDLVSRSFFQKFQRPDFPNCFVMHDLIHDLARSISGEFCFNGEEVNSGVPTNRTRHLYHGGIQFGEHVNLAQFMGVKVEVLRSLICYPNAQRHLQNKISRLRQLRVPDVFLYGGEDGISNLVAGSKRLRLMRLRGRSLERLPTNVTTLCKLQTLMVEDCQRLTTLPESIGNLKHLRHLSLARASMRLLPDSVEKLKDLRYLDLRGSEIERLPESICGMYYLQTSILRYCTQLVEFPYKMMDLINLCHLHIEGTTNVKYMPVQMGKLSKLQTLTRFVVGKQRANSFSLREFGELRNLQGRLELRNLENAVDEQSALGENLKEKKGLAELLFYWERNGANSDDDSTIDRIVLQHLQPHLNMRFVKISGYRGSSFPDWVGDSSYSNIVRMELRGCRHCTSLPPLGQLPSLEELLIKYFDSLVSVGPEFFNGSCSSTSQPSFKSLKKLEFERMPQWKEWICDDADGQRISFPLLKTLRIWECPKLSKINHLSLPLQRLATGGCNKLMTTGRLRWGLHELPSLSTLQLRDAQDVESFPGKKILLPSSLTDIEIYNLPNLKSLDCEGLKHLASIQTLEFWMCPKLESIPEEGLPSSLSYLEIRSCPLLEE
ncbi:hypothetical protein Tsubulata_019554, partial [Turnera subulata]